MATSTEPAKNLREDIVPMVEALDRRVAAIPKRHTFDIDDFTGAGGDVSRTLEKGWKPVAVYLGTARQREGDGNAVKFSSDGHVWTVTWATAPLATDYALIDAETFQ